MFYDLILCPCDKVLQFHLLPLTKIVFLLPSLPHFMGILVTILSRINILTEHRNKRRVIKYASRGFKPFLVDPQDNRSQQNVECDPMIKRKQFLPNRVKTYKDDSHTANAEIIQIQEEKMQNADRMFCCHTFGPGSLRDDFRPLGYDPRQLYRNSSNHMGVAYTMRMFETTPGDAISFFKERFSWTEDDLNAVNEIDPYLRVACLKCRNEYNLIRVVMENYPDLMKE